MHVHLTHKTAGREKTKDIVVKTALPSGQICPRYCTEGNGKQKWVENGDPWSDQPPDRGRQDKTSRIVDNVRLPDMTAAKCGRHETNNKRRCARDNNNVDICDVTTSTSQPVLASLPFVYTDHCSIFSLSSCERTYLWHYLNRHSLCDLITYLRTQPILAVIFERRNLST